MDDDSGQQQAPQPVCLYVIKASDHFPIEKNEDGLMTIQEDRLRCFAAARESSLTKSKLGAFKLNQGRRLYLDLRAGQEPILLLCHLNEFHQSGSVVEKEKIWNGGRTADAYPKRSPITPLFSSSIKDGYPNQSSLQRIS